jgi:transcriptional regulator with XRE-family HTH domain
MHQKIINEKREVLHKLLCAIRNESGLRQIDLAQLLGKPQSFVSKYESGERRLDLIEIDQICSGLGIPLTDFVKRLERNFK